MLKKMMFWLFTFFVLASLISWSYGDDTIIVHPEPKVIVKGTPSPGYNSTAPGKVLYKPPNSSVTDSATVITDVNGDHIVDVMDLALIAMQYRKTYGGRLDPLFTYDMNVDFGIDILDLSLCAKNYGLIVP